MKPADNVIEQILALYESKVDPDTFSFDLLQGPTVYQLLPPMVVEAIHQFIINPKNSGDTQKKIKFIDETLFPYGFKRMAGGTNRVVYKYLEDTSFVLKVAFDKTGITNNPDEMKNQEYLKPFVNKIFSVSPCGTVATCERVIPIRSREEFAAISGDIFDVTVKKFVGKYILEDIGNIWFKNWGIREGFGPVLLDYPYLYEADLQGLYCNEMTPFGLPCGGQIDYDDGFNVLFCTRCGKRHKAKQIGKLISNKSIKYRGGIGMGDFKVVMKRGDKIIVDRQPVDLSIDPSKIKQDNGVTVRTIGPNSWSPDDFDLVMVCSDGIKRGKKDGKWYNLGLSKSKIVQRTKPAIEDPFRKMTGNPKKKPEPIKNTEPDWINDPSKTSDIPANSDKPAIFQIDMSMFKSGYQTTDITDYTKEIAIRVDRHINSDIPVPEQLTKPLNIEVPVPSVIADLVVKSDEPDTQEIVEEETPETTEPEQQEDPVTEEPANVPKQEDKKPEATVENADKPNTELQMLVSFAVEKPNEFEIAIDDIIKARGDDKYCIISQLAKIMGALDIMTKEINDTEILERIDNSMNILHHKINGMLNPDTDKMDSDKPEESITESVSEESEKTDIDEVPESTDEDTGEFWGMMNDVPTDYDNMTEEEKEAERIKNEKEVEEYHLKERNAIAKYFDFSPEDFERSEDDLPDVSNY